MKRLTIVLLGAFSAGFGGIAGAACGGVGGDVLFGGAGGNGSSGAGPGSSTGSVNGSSAASTSSSSGVGGAASSSSSSAASSSSSSSAASSSSSSSAASSSSSSAASGSSSSSAASSSSSSGSTRPPVKCANGTCAAGEICCLDPTSNNPPDHCGQPGQCGNGFVQVTCSVPADCPGEICCAQGIVVNQGAFLYSGVSCQPTCPIGNTSFPLCDQGSTNECPAPHTCTQTNQSHELGNNYFVCN